MPAILSTNSFGSLKYRPDIDGLRAIAVMAVVFFHAKIPGFSGGYVGVDVFFVISGFLITTILLREVEKGNFSFLHFYERRICRILPALLVVMLACVAVGVFFMSSAEFAEFGKSLCAASLLFANYHFSAIQGDYWSQNTLASQPLLHTWSLAVEEQFYLVYPIFLILIYAVAVKLGKGKKGILSLIFGGFVIVEVVSLLYSELTIVDNSAKAFYFLPSRAWEFLVGGFVSLHLSKRKHIVESVSHFLGIVGAAFIFTAIIFFDAKTSFPGLSALLPCLGAAMIISAGNTEQRIGVNCVLGTQGFVFLGLISYSLYLVHWPILVFFGSTGYHAWDLPKVPLFAQLLLIITLSWLSWRFVEMPFRRVGSSTGHKSSSRLVVGFGVSLLVTAGTIGIFLTKYPLVINPLEWDSPVLIGFLDSDVRVAPGIRCEGANDPALIRLGGGGCLVGERNSIDPPAFALVGDSHARMYTEAVHTAASGYSRSAIILARSSCIPMLGIVPPTRKECLELTNASIDFLERSNIDKVILAGYWVDILSETVPEDSFAHSLEKTVDRLVKSGKSVIVMYDIPELDDDTVPYRLTLDSIRSHGKSVVGPSIEGHYAKQRRVAVVLESLKSKGKISVLDPAQQLCDPVGCLVAYQGRTLYRDKHHITDLAARRFIPLFHDVISQK